MVIAKPAPPEQLKKIIDDLNIPTKVNHNSEER